MAINISSTVFHNKQNYEHIWATFSRAILHQQLRVVTTPEHTHTHTDMVTLVIILLYAHFQHRCLHHHHHHHCSCTTITSTNNHRYGAVLYSLLLHSLQPPVITSLLLLLQYYYLSYPLLLSLPPKPVTLTCCTSLRAWTVVCEMKPVEVGSEEGW